MLSILALAALASASLAAPAPSARATSDPPSACTSLGKGALGFDPSSIGIYTKTPPGRYLGVYGNVDGTGSQVLQPGNSVPQDFELFSCKKTLNPQGGKGSTDAYQGYITSTITPGECITISEQGKFNAHFASKPCDFSSGGIAPDQHFQFQKNTFYGYYLLDFLGSTDGPTANATSTFQSGQGGYHYRLDQDDTFGSDSVSVDYAPGSYVSASNQIIAQIGQTAAPPTFPACRLRKTGPMTYTAPGGAAQSVTVNPVPLVNGTQSYTAFQFYECESDYMGYESDASAGIFYGHFQLASHTSCYVQQNGQFGKGNGLMFAFSGTDSPCGNSDTATQEASFFKYDANTGSVNFLNAAKGKNPSPVGWTLADGYLNLAFGSTDGVFAFAK